MRALPWSRWFMGPAFPLFMWAASRAMILLGWYLLAPLQGPVSPGWLRWDAGWYEAIATHGYEFAPDGRPHRMAFFPLFPLLVRWLQATGLDFSLAGTLLSHLCFLAALFVLHRMARARHGAVVARWSVAAIAWCPFSVFAAIPYTEGLFLLLTALTLASWEAGRTGLAGLAGLLATATRVTALPLVPAMLYATWRERRGPAAYLAALASGLGLVAFMGYGLWRFGDPLAFLHAQRGWRQGLGFDWRGWQNLLTFGATGPAPYNGAVKLLMGGGGLALLWAGRRELSPVVLSYGLVAWALIMASGSLDSIDRYLFGVLPLGLAFGLWASRHPRWGLGFLLLFGLGLVSFAVRLALGQWVG